MVWQTLKSTVHLSPSFRENMGLSGLQVNDAYGQNMYLHGGVLYANSLLKLVCRAALEGLNKRPKSNQHLLRLCQASLSSIKEY